MAYYDEALGVGSILKANNGWGKMYKLMEDGRLAPLTEQTSLGDVVREKRTGREDSKAKEIFVTSGQVLFDLAWGFYLYEKALKEGIGTTLKIWDAPCWL